MEFDAGFLIFLFVFFILPLLQRILGGAKKQPPPRGRPGQGPPARVPAPQRRPLPDARERTPTAAESSPASRPSAETSDADRAAELIPAELWEILTGERRVPAPQRPVPPTPSPEADVDEELAQDEETAAGRSAVDEDRAAAELLRRRERDTERDRLVVREPVQIVSLETEPLPEPARHAAFHREVATLPAAVVARKTRPRPAMLPSLDNRTDLMRAIVLQEVLGRPKGLD